MESFHSFEEADHAAEDLLAAASRFEVTAEFRQFVIRAAIEAPSGDNMQPWKFRWLPDGELEVYLDQERITGVLERTGHAPLISVGAVLENIAVAAASRGAHAEVALAAKNIPGAPIAVVNFEEDISIAPAEHATAIFERRTDRGVFDLRNIPLQVVAELAGAGDSERPNVRAIFIADENERHHVLDVCAQVDAVRFGNKTLHEEFFQKLHFGSEAADARQGLTEQSLGISKGEAKSFAALKPWAVMRAGKQAGLHRFMANKSKCVSKTAPLLVAIVLRKQGTKNSICAGRVAQRLWLRATEHRLGLQPISVLPLLAPLCAAESDVFNDEERSAILTANDEMANLLGLADGESLAFLVRIGFPVHQGPKSKRRAPHEFMIAGGTVSNDGGWDYETAVSRHTGLITPEEQRTLRSACIAIAGLGGVGGSHLITLARMGIGNFHLADFDRFECTNFNRQHGAMMSSIGKPKIDVMAALGRDVNPELGLRLFPEGLTEENLNEFLNGADLVIDGLDFFEIEKRRKLFAEARRRGLWVITAGPIGAGSGWLVFSPHGMDFDTYFDFRDGMTDAEKFAAFAVGLVPRALHLKYVDMKKHFNPTDRSASSLGLGCNLASAIAATEAMKILLNRPGVRAAPWFGQFDAYRGVCVQRRLHGGNRNPLQRLKRRWLLRKVGAAAADEPKASVLGRILRK